MDGRIEACSEEPSSSGSSSPARSEQDPSTSASCVIDSRPEGGSPHHPEGWRGSTPPFLVTYSGMSSSSGSNTSERCTTAPEKGENTSPVVISSDSDVDLSESTPPRRRPGKIATCSKAPAKDISIPVVIDSSTSSSASNEDFPDVIRPRRRRHKAVTPAKDISSPVVTDSQSSASHEDVREVTRPRLRHHKKSNRCSTPSVTPCKRPKKKCPVSGCGSQVVWISRHLQRVHKQTKQQARHLEVEAQGSRQQGRKEGRPHKLCPVPTCSALILRVDMHLSQVSKSN